MNQLLLQKVGVHLKDALTLW